MVTIRLDWQGPLDADALPSGPGIFCVWTAVLHDGQPQPGTSRLVFIGEADNLVAQVPPRAVSAPWAAGASVAERVIVSYAVPPTPEDARWRQTIAACLIAVHRPPGNADAPLPSVAHTVTIRHSGRTFGSLSDCSCRGVAHADRR